MSVGAKPNVRAIPLERRRPRYKHRLVPDEGALPRGRLSHTSGWQVACRLVHDHRRAVLTALASDPTGTASLGVQAGVKKSSGVIGVMLTTTAVANFSAGP